MTNARLNKIESLFMKNHGYASTAELIQSGADSRFILKFVNTQKIIRIKHGLYQWGPYTPESDEEMILLSKTLTNGIFCLFTALSYHGLTTYNPREYNMAIFRDAKKPILPAHPPLKVFYFSEKQYQTGISVVKIEGHPIRIFDPEKTICDCVRYRNKIGRDIMHEALKEYMVRRERDLEKIWRYARILGIETVIKPLLEALA